MAKMQSEWPQVVKVLKDAIVFVLLLSPVAVADQQLVERVELPSPELLEFLAEFGDADDETYDLVLHHAREDSAAAKRVEQGKIKDARSKATQAEITSQDNGY